MNPLARFQTKIDFRAFDPEMLVK